MKILSLQYKNFRNLKETKLVPHSNINIIYGDNAQGKTNILESIWILTGGHSFRGHKDKNLIAFEQDFAKVECEFKTIDRSQSIKIVISNKNKKATLNNVPKKSISMIVGKFCCVVFSPEHLSLVKNSPAERRKFLDTTICQMKPSYVSLLVNYNKTLEHRNALLKNLYKSPSLESTLDVWDERLSFLGALIASERIDYTSKLSLYSKAFYDGISGNKEHLRVLYNPSYIKDCENTQDIKLSLYNMLKTKLQESINLGFTTVGPQRDDLLITIDGKDAKKFASQGQQRSCVLALKLSEASILKEITGEEPIILLDDVMSELDSGRQDFLINKIKDKQVFITCCSEDAVLKLQNGRSFHIQDGGIISS